jgi:hypothetical protein
VTWRKGLIEGEQFNEGIFQPPPNVSIVERCPLSFIMSVMFYE